jgi:DNA-binding LytR/AlgR family response regulator
VKIRIEVAPDLSEDEVIIRCGRVDDTIRRIHQYVAQEAQAGSKITFYKQNQEFYFPLETVLFFETEGEHIYAHTADDAYRIKHRLYELEELLPKDFIRASKSTIVNVRQVYSISRNITASSLVKFVGSHKQVYVSRYYYNTLRGRLSPGGNRTLSGG